MLTRIYGLSEAGRDGTVAAGRGAARNPLLVGGDDPTHRATARQPLLNAIYIYIYIYIYMYIYLLGLQGGLSTESFALAHAGTTEWISSVSCYHARAPGRGRV